MKSFLLLLSVLVSNMVVAQQSQSYTNLLELNHHYGLYYFTEEEHFVHLQTSIAQTAQPYANSKEYFTLTPPFAGTHNITIQLEANRKISPNFHFGIAPQIDFKTDNKTFGIRPNLLHHGKIYKLQFLKSFGLNLTKQVKEKNNNPYISTDPVTLATFDIGLALAYKITSTKLPIRFMLSYKAYFIKEFTEENAKIYDKRYIDIDQLRLSIQTLMLNKFNIGLWGAIENQYLFGLASNISQEKNIRIITPLIGWEINYFLGKPNQKNNYSFIF
ncbi:MAG: hypothetical protein RL060_646 [Bacteroidota bacterium]